jgi:hypothetical protein
MTNKMRILRWVFFPPAAASGFFVSMLFFIFVHEWLSDWCPWGDPISGMCPWPAWVDGAFMSGGGGGAAFLVVIFGSLVAPANRTQVAWILYITGVLYTAFLVWNMWFGGSSAQGQMELVVAMFVTYVAGLVAVLIVRKYELRTEGKASI